MPLEISRTEAAILVKACDFALQRVYATIDQRLKRDLPTDKSEEVAEEIAELGDRIREALE